MPVQPLILMDEDGLLPGLDPESYPLRRAQHLAMNVPPAGEGSHSAPGSRNMVKSNQVVRELVLTHPSSFRTVMLDAEREIGKGNTVEDPFADGTFRVFDSSNFDGANKPSTAGSSGFGRKARDTVMMTPESGGLEQPSGGNFQQRKRRQSFRGIERRESFQRNDSSDQSSGMGSNLIESILRNAPPSVLAKLITWSKDAGLNQQQNTWNALGEFIDLQKKIQSHVSELQNNNVLETLATSDEDGAYIFNSSFAGGGGSTLMNGSFTNNASFSQFAAMSPRNMRASSPFSPLGSGSGTASPYHRSNTENGPFSGRGDKPGGGGTTVPLPTEGQIDHWERNMVVGLGLLDQLLCILNSLAPSLSQVIEVVRNEVMKACFVEGETYAMANQLPSDPSSFLSKCASITALQRFIQQFQVRLWSVDLVKKKISDVRFEQKFAQKKETNKMLDKVVDALKKNVDSWRSVALKYLFRSWRDVIRGRKQEEERNRSIIRMRGEIEFLGKAHRQTEQRERNVKESVTVMNIEFHEHVKDLEKQIQKFTEEKESFLQEKDMLLKQISEIKSEEAQAPVARLHRELHQSVLAVRELQKKCNDLREQNTDLELESAELRHTLREQSATLAEYNALVGVTNKELQAKLKKNKQLFLVMNQFLERGHFEEGIAAWANKLANEVIQRKVFQTALRTLLAITNTTKITEAAKKKSEEGLNLKELSSFTEPLDVLLDIEICVLHYVHPAAKGGLTRETVLQCLLSSDLYEKGCIISRAVHHYHWLGLSSMPSHEQELRSPLLNSPTMEYESLRRWPTADDLCSEENCKSTHLALLNGILQRWIVNISANNEYDDHNDEEKESSQPPLTAASSSDSPNKLLQGTMPPEEATRTKSPQEWSEELKQTSTLYEIWKRNLILIQQNSQDRFHSLSSEFLLQAGGFSSDASAAMTSQQKIQEKMIAGDPLTAILIDQLVDTLPGSVGEEGSTSSPRKPTPLKESDLVVKDQDDVMEKLSHPEAVQAILKTALEFSDDLVSMFRHYANLSSNSAFPTLVLSPNEAYRLAMDASVSYDGKTITRDGVRDMIQMMANDRRRTGSQLESQIRHASRVGSLNSDVTSLRQQQQQSDVARSLASLALHSQFEIPLEELVVLILRFSYFQKTGSTTLFNKSLEATVNVNMSQTLSSQTSSAAISPNIDINIEPLSATAPVGVLGAATLSSALSGTIKQLVLLFTQFCKYQLSISPSIIKLETKVLRENMYTPDCRRVLDVLSKPLLAIFQSLTAKQDMKTLMTGAPLSARNNRMSE